MVLDGCLRQPGQAANLEEPPKFVAMPQVRGHVAPRAAQHPATASVVTKPSQSPDMRRRLQRWAAPRRGLTVSDPRAWSRIWARFQWW
jgi:hypothetical protein